MIVCKCASDFKKILIISIRNFLFLAICCAVMLPATQLSAQAQILPQTAPKPPETSPAKDRVLSVKSVSDGELQNKLKRVLENIDDFKKVKVSVQDGVVTLQGVVTRSETEKKVENLISRFEGVLYVNNKITDEADIENRIVPVMARLRKYVATFINKLPLFAIAIPVFLLFLFVGKLAGAVIMRFSWFGENRLARNLLARAVTTIFIFSGLLLALDIIDITSLVGAVVGIAGLGGLALGFAFRDIMENYLAGILMSLRRPFAINDYVSVAGFEGKVVRMTSRELILMTYEWNQVIIPNATVFKSVLTNFTRNRLRQFTIEVGVGFAEKLPRVREIGLKALQDMAGVADNPGPLMSVVKLGDFSVIVKFFAWVDQSSADYLKVRSEATRTIKETFDNANINMPLPASVVQVKSFEEAQDKKIEVARPEVATKHSDVQIDTQLSKKVAKEASSEKNLLKEGEDSGVK